MAESNPKLIAGHAVLTAPNTIYADQVAQLGIGPMVTKMTFGIGEVQGEVPRPVVTVVMPTNAVLAMCKHIVEAMKLEPGKAAIIAELETYLVALKQ